MEEKFTTIKKVDDKIQSFWRLEGEVKLDDERVVESFKDHPLDLSVVHLILAQYHVLFQCLHCKDAIVISLLHLVHFSE